MKDNREFHVKQTSDVEDILIDDRQRKRYDIFCIICSSIFAAVLLIIAIFSMNQQNLNKMSYPTDITGKTCGYEIADYPILYFASLDDPTKRLCVKQCPSGDESELACQSTQTLSCYKNDNPKYQVNIYPSYLDESRIGFLCLPKDEDQKQQILSNAGIADKYNFLSFYDSMWQSMWISVLMALVFVILLQFFPLKVVPWTTLLGGIFLIVLGVYMIALATGSIFLRILAGIIAIGFGIPGIYTIINKQRRQALFTCARLMYCATEVFKENFLLILYVPIFWVFFIGLVALIGFEVLAFKSIGDLVFEPEDPYLTTNGFLGNLLAALAFIEFYWGVFFLKEAFNFIMSGYACQYYFYKKNDDKKISFLKSPKYLLCYHWGSVSGGSFLIAIFYWIDYIIDFFKGEDGKKDRAEVDYDQRIEQNKGCLSIFDLVRSESMAYINCLSVAYCNAARYCQLLSRHSKFYKWSQTTQRVYRFSAHGFILSFVVLIAILTMKSFSGNSGILGILFVQVVSVFTMTYFICMHSDLSMGIMVSIYIEQWLARGQIDKPLKFIQDVYEDDIEDKYQGKSIKDILIGKDENFVPRKKD